MFECFISRKLIILNLNLCFELNYFYGSLKSLLILSLEPKKYFNSPKQEKRRFPKKDDAIPKSDDKIRYLV